MGEYTGESWDGFDGRDYQYDEKKEKRWASSVWKILVCLSVFMLFVVFYDHMSEVQMAKNGRCIEAEYDERTMTAKYIDENGKWYTFNLGNYEAEIRDGYIRMYYMDDIRLAKPEGSIKTKVMQCLFFLLMLAFSGRKVWKIYHD